MKKIFFQREPLNFLDHTTYGGYLLGAFHILWLVRHLELTRTRLFYL